MLEKSYVGKKVCCARALIDDNTLADIMIDHNLSVTSRDMYEIKEIDLDYFTE